MNRTTTYKGFTSHLAITLAIASLIDKRNKISKLGLPASKVALYYCIVYQDPY